MACYWGVAWKKLVKDYGLAGGVNHKPRHCEYRNKPPACGYEPPETVEANDVDRQGVLF